MTNRIKVSSVGFLGLISLVFFVACASNSKVESLCFSNDSCYRKLLWLSELSALPSSSNFYSSWEEAARLAFLAGIGESVPFFFAESLQRATEEIGQFITKSSTPPTVGFLTDGYAAGASNAQVFTVEGSGTKMLVKFFPASVVMGLAKEIRGRERLSSLALKNISTPEILAVSRVYVAGEEYWVKVEKFVSGKPLNEIVNLHCANYFSEKTFDHKAAIKKELLGVIKTVAESMAELASSKIEYGVGLHPFWGDYFKYDLYRVEVFLKESPEHASVIKDFISWYEGQVEKVLKLRTLPLSYAHLDFHTGNILYAEDSGEVTYIDLEDFGLSVSLSGAPLAMAVQDFERLHILLGLFKDCSSLQVPMQKKLKSVFSTGVPEDLFLSEISTLLKAFFILKHAYWHPEGFGRMKAYILSEDWDA